MLVVHQPLPIVIAWLVVRTTLLNRYCSMGPPPGVIQPGAMPHQGLSNQPAVQSATLHYIATPSGASFFAKRRIADYSHCIVGH